MDIRKLMLDAKDKQSNEYKEGWNNAICYLNDNYCVTKRNGEPIQISFEINFDEKEFEEKIKRSQNAG